MTTKTLGAQLRPFRGSPRNRLRDSTKNGETYASTSSRTHRYVEMRQKTGNVVLSLNGGPQ